MNPLILRKRTVQLNRSGLGKLCEASGRIDWSTRSGKLRSLLIPKGWLTVKQAKKLPEPANAWLFDQWSRNKFTRWLE